MGIGRDWFRRQKAKSELAVTKVGPEYINKAAEKFASLSIKKQCESYLPLLTTAKLCGTNIHQLFIDGMISDYNEAYAKSPISVDDWLKPYLAEPLFFQVLSKCKTTQTELEETLKGEKHES
jgi:hypothetical protein